MEIITTKITTNMIKNLNDMKKMVFVAVFVTAFVSLRGQGYTTLGVGISQPVGTLHVHSSANIIPPITPGTNDGDGNRDVMDYETVVHVTNGNTGTTATDGFSIDQYNGNVTIRQFEEGSVSLLGYNGQGFTLGANGFLGIGTATPSYRLHVVGDGYVYGDMAVTGAGWVGSGYHKLSVGEAPGADLSYGTAYVGFNARRTATGWQRMGDGSHNGGAVVWGTVNGDILFANLPSTGGSGVTGMTDQAVKANVNLRLCADGLLMAKEVKVTLTGWPDYVFGADYRLRSLAETEAYIDANGHLPGVPSAEEVEACGLSLGEMDKVLLQKVEELTLHVIELQKQIDEQKKGRE